MDKLQHVQNAAARLVTGTRKYEPGLSRLMHDDLHWLVIPQRVQYKLAVTVHRCLRHRAPRYLADYCVPVSEVPGRQHLRSAGRHHLSVPRVRRNTFGTRAFSVAGPTVRSQQLDKVRSVWTWMERGAGCGGSFLEATTAAAVRRPTVVLPSLSGRWRLVAARQSILH